MLWCKKTFQRTFDEAECRLFPTQKQLFDFLDSRPPAAESLSGWFPFSIELLSERETVEALSRHGKYHSNGKGQPPALFKVGERVAASPPGTPLATTKNHAEGPLRKGIRGPLVVRHDFSLLYGETPLSAQSRMFLAATRKGLEHILTTIEPRQLHLYEVIREGTPCHLYFDVEREGDTVSLQEEVFVSSSGSSSCEDDNSEPVVAPFAGKRRRAEDGVIVTATLHSRHGTSTYRSTRREYRALVQEAAELPRRACPLDCAITPNNNLTTQVLLEELDDFVRHRFPFLLPGEAAQCGVGEDACAASTSGMALPEWAQRLIVLDSLRLPSTERAEPQPRKFSQHYIIQLKRHVFDSNASVGEFVRQFVQFLELKCDQGQRRVHETLFFHCGHLSATVLRSVTPERPSAALPFLARKCVIDTAVYGRNRMMRCLGSCKLHKTSTLQVAHWIPHPTVASTSSTRSGAAPLPVTVDMLCGSLICAWGGAPSLGSTGLLHLESTTGEATGGESALAVPPTTPRATFGEEVSTTGTSSPRPEAVAAVLGSVYRRISGCEACSIGPARQLGTRFEVLPVHGTRFCQNVMREHKSNSIYIVVDKLKQTWVQKCFDPDCAHYRSAPLPLRLPDIGEERAP